MGDGIEGGTGGGWTEREFRAGDEASDVVDRGVQAFVGDPRLRDQINAEGISTIAGLETAANEQGQRDAAELGIPFVRVPGLDEILSAYEDEVK